MSLTEDIENGKNISGKKFKNHIFLVIFLLIIAGIFGGIFYYNNILPKNLINSGKKYLEIKQFNKALKIFRYLEDRQPRKIEPLYYEVLTLAKMIPTYENQQRLYEISQYDDNDEAARLANSILNNFRKQIYFQAGINYADNILFENSVIRWNNSHPLTYTVVQNSKMPDNFMQLTDNAFMKWQNSTAGEFQFKKTNGNANIVIHLVHNFPEYTKYTLKDFSALTIPGILEGKLSRMDIYIKIDENNEKNFSDEKLYSILLHQIGHALGIGAHSSHKEDIMYFNGDFTEVEFLNTEISRRDLNTLNILYKIVPNYIDEELPENIKNNLLYSPIITTYPGENYRNETQILIQELKEDKKNLGKWINLASNYSKNREYLRANLILENILPLFENTREIKFAICYNIALNYYKIKNYVQASKYLNMAEDIARDKATKTLNAFIDVKLGALELAEEKLKLLLKYNYNDIDIAVKLAEVYYKEGKGKEARRIIEKLIKINSEATKDKRVIKYGK